MNVFSKKLIEFDFDQVSQIYKNVFSSEEGKLVLEDLKNRCFIYNTLPDGELGQRGEGMRKVVLWIESQIGHEPTLDNQGVEP